MKRLKLISLFTGAGGLDIGLEQSGFETVVAIDSDKDCIETLRFNKGSCLQIEGFKNRCYLDKSHILHSDLTKLQIEDLISVGLDDNKQPDLLAGGPPCQPFSSSGAQKSVLDDRGRLFEHFVRLANALRPRIILFENVRGLVTARGPSGKPGEALMLVRKEFENIGYSTRFGLLNAADFGCPQRRVRLFMIGTLDHILPHFPEPTHSPNGKKELFGNLKPWVTLGDFLSSMPEPDPEEIVLPSDKLAPLLSKLDPGCGLKSPGKKEATRPGGHWGYKQGTFIADPKFPARTVTAASTQDWIKMEDGSLRRLTISECAALQGFPSSWQFIGSKTSKFRQIGNAVPVIFGKVLGNCISKALNYPLPEQAPCSAPLPQQMLKAINYTSRDHMRNRASRTRANIFVKGNSQDGDKLVKKRTSRSECSCY